MTLIGQMEPEKSRLGEGSRGEDVQIILNTRAVEHAYERGVDPMFLPEKGAPSWWALETAATLAAGFEYDGILEEVLGGKHPLLGSSLSVSITGEDLTRQVQQVQGEVSRFFDFYCRHIKENHPKRDAAGWASTHRAGQRKLQGVRICVAGILRHLEGMSALLLPEMEYKISAEELGILRSLSTKLQAAVAGREAKALRDSKNEIEGECNIERRHQEGIQTAIDIERAPIERSRMLAQDARNRHQGHVEYCLSVSEGLRAASPGVRENWFWGQN